MDKVIIKECPKHGLTEHVLRNDGKYRCRKCSSESVSKRRRELKKELVEYKGGKCEICGYDKCIDALEFHHIDPSEKEFGISNGNYTSFEKAKKEVDKCMLICANCHREIHYDEKIQKLIKQTEIYKQRILSKKTNKNIKINLLNLCEIQKDISNKLTQKEIANKYNVSISTIKRFLKQNDIKMRKDNVKE